MADEVEILADSRYIRLLRRGHWEYAERKNISGIVGIVAVTDDGKLLLVEQYRIPVVANVIELPAGLAGDQPGTEGEPLVEAARRELLEETGYEAREMVLLTEGPPTAGMTNEIITLFLARGPRKVHAGGGDHTEAITVHEVPVDDAPRWLEARRAEGKLIDSRIYAGLFFLHSCS